MKQLLIWPIRLYQRYISRWTPSACRFHPTCSHYTAEAIEKHGAIKGSLLGAYRICRCNPFHPGGIDPVPEKGRWRSTAEQKSCESPEVCPFCGGGAKAQEVIDDGQDALPADASSDGKSHP